jgi:hypothetical protein
MQRLMRVAFSAAIMIVARKEELDSYKIPLNALGSTLYYDGNEFYA